MLLTVGSLLMSLVLYSLFAAAETRHLEAEFRALARRDVDSLSADFEVFETRLTALAQLFASNESVDSAKFATFVGGMHRIAGIQAYEWLPRVAFADLVAHEAAAIADGLANYRVTEGILGPPVSVEAREEYVPVRFVWPLEGNQRAVGFDLASNPARKSVLHRARDSGEMSLSPPITLVQERGTQRGLLLILPRYAKGAPHATIEERRAALEGYALMVIRTGDFVEGMVAASRSRPVGLNVKLSHSKISGEPGDLYTHSSRVSTSSFTLGSLATNLEYRRVLGPEVPQSREFDVERDLVVTVTPSPAFASLHASGMLPLALLRNRHPESARDLGDSPVGSARADEGAPHRTGTRRTAVQDRGGGGGQSREVRVSFCHEPRDSDSHERSARNGRGAPAVEPQGASGGDGEDDSPLRAVALGDD